jgi:elongation factor G
MKYYTFEGDNGETQVEHDIPADIMEVAQSKRETLLDAISLFDDELAEKFLAGEEISEALIKKAIRAGVVSNQLYPVLVGSALKNAGVQLMLDAVVDFMPSPLDIGSVKGTDPDHPEKVLERKPSDDEPVSALAFKIMTDPFVGTLTFVRVYSGVIKSGDVLLNPVTGQKERVGRLLLMHANKREEITEVHAGHIAAFLGLKEVYTGHTLTDIKDPILLESMDFPEPVISLAIEPKSKKDQEKMGIALSKLAQEDPSFKYYTDAESNQTIIAGMGELHLEIIVDRMKREYKVEVDTGKPQVAYREAITQKAEGEGKFTRQTGGRGQYGHVLLRLEPITEGDENYIFESEIKG